MVLVETITDSDVPNLLQDVLQVYRKDIQFHVNDQVCVEALLLNIRWKSISYSAHKLRVKKERELCLLSEIQRLELYFGWVFHIKRLYWCLAERAWKYKGN